MYQKSRCLTTTKKNIEIVRISLLKKKINIIQKKKTHIHTYYINNNKCQ